MDLLLYGLKFTLISWSLSEKNMNLKSDELHQMFSNEEWGKIFIINTKINLDISNKNK